jgi:hypothetical protein
MDMDMDNHGWRDDMKKKLDQAKTWGGKRLDAAKEYAKKKLEERETDKADDKLVKQMRALQRKSLGKHHTDPSGMPALRPGERTWAYAE